MNHRSNREKQVNITLTVVIVTITVLLLFFKDDCSVIQHICLIMRPIFQECQESLHRKLV